MNRWASPLLFLTLAAASAHALDVTAGPMVGHVTDKSVRIWMQFPIAGDVTINAFDVENNRPVSGLKVGLEGPTPFVLDVPINGLEPNSTYRIEVKFDGQPIKLPGPELVLRTAPVAGEEATFSVAFGSGIQIAPQPPASVAATQIAPVFRPHRMPVFQAITDTKPRAFFFLGDTGMLPERLEDFPVTHRAAYRYLADFHSLIRREPDLQPLLRTTPCYAVFDDRDFGPIAAPAPGPASGRGPASAGPVPEAYVFAPEALLAFQRFWPNPDWGTPANPGCFSMCSFGDVDFFLLDTRTFRTASALLGEAQLDWLEKNIRGSRATFKILAAPCTLWGDDARNPEGDSWSRFPAEQQAFLRWLGDNQVNGLAAIAGNQLAGQMTRITPDPALRIRYPLFTLGCSTLAGLAPPAPQPALPDNAHRLGQPVAGDTFGTLDFTGTREHRTLTLRLHDVTGKTRLEQVLLASQLHN